MPPVTALRGGILCFSRSRRQEKGHVISEAIDSFQSACCFSWASLCPPRTSTRHNPFPPRRTRISLWGRMMEPLRATTFRERLYLRTSRKKARADRVKGGTRATGVPQPIELEDHEHVQSGFPELDDHSGHRPDRFGPGKMPELGNSWGRPSGGSKRPCRKRKRIRRIQRRRVSDKLFRGRMSGEDCGFLPPAHSC